MFENVIFDFVDVSAEACIQLMFKFTDESGVLIMPGWYDDIDVPKYWLKLKLDWVEEDANALVKEFHKLETQLEHLVATNNFDGIEKEIEALGKMRTEHPMLLRGAQRLFKLKEIHAPEVVCNREAGALAQVLAVCRYAVSLERFDEVEQALGL